MYCIKLSVWTDIAVRRLISLVIIYIYIYTVDTEGLLGFIFKKVHKFHVGLFNIFYLYLYINIFNMYLMRVIWLVCITLSTILEIKYLCWGVVSGYLPLRHIATLYHIWHGGSLNELLVKDVARFLSHYIGTTCTQKYLSLVS